MGCSAGCASSWIRNARRIAAWRGHAQRQPNGKRKETGSERTSPADPPGEAQPGLGPSAAAACSAHHPDQAMLCLRVEKSVRNPRRRQASPHRHTAPLRPFSASWALCPSALALGPLSSRPRRALLLVPALAHRADEHVERLGLLALAARRGEGARRAGGQGCGRGSAAQRGPPTAQSAPRALLLCPACAAPRGLAGAARTPWPRRRWRGLRARRACAGARGPGASPGCARPAAAAARPRRAGRAPARGRGGGRGGWRRRRRSGRCGEERAGTWRLLPSVAKIQRADARRRKRWRCSEERGAARPGAARRALGRA